jgi:hypothetical protein
LCGLVYMVHFCFITSFSSFGSFLHVQEQLLWLWRPLLPSRIEEVF